MKISRAPNRNCSGQFMAEAAIGLALMTFAWIIITYSLFMGNNQTRTVMAARYAAWYAGSNNGTLPTTDQIDQYFFYQSGVSTVNNSTAENVSDLIPSFIPSIIRNIFNFSDGSAGNGPFKATVTFGVQDANSTVFPFSLLKTHVPFMPTSEMTNVLSVQSSCQWDGDADTYGSSDTLFQLIGNTIKNLATPNPQF